MQGTMYGADCIVLNCKMCMLECAKLYKFDN